MIVYTDSLEGVSSEHVAGFFEGWQDPPDAETHLKLLRNSGHVVLAKDETSGKVVGFVTALTDGVLCACIPFLEVRPEFRSHGVGAELVKRMLEKVGDLYLVEFVCHPDMQPFYTRLGLKPSTGMMRRNLKRQSGAA